MVLVIITAISLFVTALLAFAIVRYNRRANPNPAKFTHNSPLEVAWTIIPIVILVFIGAFSLPVLFKQQEIPEGEINIKVTGYQWYWGYEYTDHEFGFESFLIGEGKVLNDEVVAELEAAGYTRDEFLLATDTAVVVPVNKTVVMTVTGADVIHSLDHPRLRREAGRGAGPSGAALVQGREGRRLFRPMLRALRQGPRLYADHRQGRQRRSL